METPAWLLRETNIVQNAKSKPATRNSAALNLATVAENPCLDGAVPEPINTVRLEQAPQQVLVEQKSQLLGYG